MICKKCGAELPDSARFCMLCGVDQAAEPKRKKRGNGQGSVFQIPGGKYRAVVTLGYYLDEEGVMHRQTASKVYAKKKDAVLAINELRSSTADRRRDLTFGELYDAWRPTHRAGRSTMDCYAAAFRHFASIHRLPMQEITVDDLQECLDDCPAGKQTRRNMRTLCGLIYKYGIPRKCVPDGMDLSKYLVVDGDATAHRISFTDLQIEQIRRAVGVVPGADAIYAMIYTGFRPSEFLSLRAENYNAKSASLTGGAKTEAGKNRIVTVSPRIKPIIESRAAAGGVLFSTPNGQQWTLKAFTEKSFYPALEQIGIDNPLVEVGAGAARHLYSPHSCRHTFATLLKRTAGADKDKLELIGHSSGEMLRYYQDVAIDDLKRITDAI